MIRQMDTPSIDLTAFILAGGKSTRMGTDKAFVRLDGQTLIERMLQVARKIAPEVAVVGDPTKFAKLARVVGDEFPNCGPLGGIHAALSSSSTDWNLILAVDVPFVTPAFLEFLIATSRESSATVTVVRTREGLQPLCAIYRRAFVSSAERALRNGHYKVDALFSESDLRVIDETELRASGFSAELFHNLNTPEDLSRANRSIDAS
jgi:molybdopterin-guanine dinucleotide biosynthesis protein A